MLKSSEEHFLYHSKIASNNPTLYIQDLAKHIMYKSSVTIQNLLNGMSWKFPQVTLHWKGLNFTFSFSASGPLEDLTTFSSSP